MDGDWEEVGRLLLPPPGQHALHTPVASMAFDSTQELLWTGNDFGRVSSFYGAELTRYTSFKAGDTSVRQLLFHEKGVIAVCARSVHMATRKGPPIWHIQHEEMKDLYCMSYTSRGTSEILVAGMQEQMFTIDVDKGTITKQIPTKDHYTIMKRSRYICAALRTGSINILDPISFSVLKTWKAHSSLINDMDAQHDFIVTCGYSLRQQQNYMLDPLVNVFDLKNMNSMSPIPFPAGAAFVRMHPRMSTTSIVVGHQGQIHIIDLMNVNTSNVRHANTFSQFSMMEIAPSGEAMVFSDMDCNIHLWGSPSRIRYAELSNPVEFADPEEALPQMDWSVNSPLNSVGMPYYREQLLSAWPSHMIFNTGAPPPKIDTQGLSIFKVVDGITFYVNNSRSMKRNQVENTRAAEKPSTSLKAPKFLSEKARDSVNDTSMGRRISDVTDAIGAAELLGLKADVPGMYWNVEIKYSKFGIDDFDFGFYNKTAYSGLETHIPNSYANPLIQIMHFTPCIRNRALEHTATACINDMCMLCEMGFLFDMLEKAEGSICQATNMLKTFSSHPQSRPLGLLEEDAPGSSLTTMLQGLNRFTCDIIVQDYASMSPPAPHLHRVLAMEATTYIQCTSCGNEPNKSNSSYVTNLLYPAQKPVARNSRPQRATFSDVLRLSLECEQKTRGWCPRCQRYLDLKSRRAILNLPGVLMLNAAITTAEVKQLWATPKWLPEEIGIVRNENTGRVFCYQDQDLKYHLQRGAHDLTVYSLIGFAADIDSGQHQKSHLVSLVNVAHSRPEAPGESQWHLFNDFLVQPVKTEDALTFNSSWKMPSVITYQVKAGNNRIDNSWKRNLDTSLLYIDYNKNPGGKTYRPLVPQEAPKEGTVVALDAEFVKIKQPEIEVNSEGERETIRPTVHALARVSAVRGSGILEGVPFIDDYVAAKEPIVDYLTAFSGILPGDLDPQISKHYLVSLKVAYKRLWVLLNLGCIFLGHGLKQDFRVTNIHVPKSQVIDTIDLFFIKIWKRKLSLAYLAWVLLKEPIQQETHDSIEDARTALRLYRKYEEYQDAGILETILQDVYNKGQETKFKPPSAKKEGLAMERSATPVSILGDGPNLRVGTPGVASGPTTPIRRPAGLVPGAGSSGRFTPGRGNGINFGGSPLR